MLTHGSTKLVDNKYHAYGYEVSLKTVSHSEKQGLKS